MRDLGLTPDVVIPPDAVTQKFAFLGISGSGKTYGAGRFVEGLLDASAQVVVVDNVGNWWGLRVPNTGNRGYAIPILGGPRGDVAIEPTHGKLVAETVVESRSSMIVTISEFTQGEVRRFVVDFATELLRLQMKHPSPVMVVWEEVQDIVPQRVFGEDAKMVGAVERLVKRGRNYGIGSTLISQRSAAVNKDVLNQIETLFCFRMNATGDRKAIADWIAAQGDNDAQWKHINAELPGVATGECFLWSPHWLKILRRVRIAEKRTFDASATPKFSKSTKSAVPMTAVDLTKFKASMSDAIEKAKASDPDLLRQRVAELEKQLKQTPTEPVPMLDAADWKRLDKIADRLHEDVAALDKQRDRLAQAQQAVVTELGNLRTLIARAQAKGKPASPPRAPTRARSTAKPASDADAADLTGPEQRVLESLAWFASIGIHDPVAEAVAFLADYSPTSSSFSNTRGSLRGKGLIELPEAGKIALTTAGQAIAPVIQAPLNSAELHQHVLARLPGPERKLLVPILAAYPDRVNAADVADVAGYSLTSSSFSNARGRLRTLGLIEIPAPGVLRAASFLFLE